MIAKHKETEMMHSWTSNGVIAQKILNKLRSVLIILELHPWLAGSVLVVIFVALFGFLQRHPTILDSDSLYHAKIVEFLSQGILVKNFPWLPLTLLANYYTDHHFLYHLILVPFVLLFDPIVVLKVAIVILGPLALLVYFWTMRRFQVIGAFWWTFFAGTSWPLLFRLNLVKALPLSLIIYFLGLVCLKENRYHWLAVLSFIYVWTYGGWPLLLVSVALYSAGLFFIGKEKLYSSIAPLGWSFFGSVAGIIINPYFPTNLTFFQRQIIDIALIPTSISVVGNEWFRFPWVELFTAAAPLFVVSLVVITILIIDWLTDQTLRFNDSKEKVFYLTMGIISCSFLLLTLISRRYVEYFIPLGHLATALWLSVLWRSGTTNPFYQIIKDWSLSKWWYAMTALLIIFFIVVYTTRTVRLLDKRFENGWSFIYLKGASQWLESRVPSRTMVYNLRWDDFPALFYFAPNLSYVSGLDLRFLDGDNEARLKEWENIYRGVSSDPAAVIRNSFKAEYVLVSDFHTEEAVKMFNAHKFPIIYKDSEATIYAVP
ncbi:hypothetical protein A3H10_04400 [Candidatus Uhrbacteria bacterium RIFCSPLOWO2_12_FULL_46_10]|uniref:Glycosyltransferase RgtA/B/C/D-like domain-containing protein n=1 Tax=Candidatus Uhrbacteria bacterium RIFCSPLOWO2_01_FULL_47_25 TaxID=1802402 RepID=A0A1F7UXU8_9BACT|nr:MAG: hypothetical protein A2752_03195 [Candidatus Uhrbacteria bacterium RIFCSPHIGHO2_01_FULL_46_23]OGL70562.1 MAG: hypothetical protein A3D60_03765 [Candidatus Uhrbacteria bacterium RIFCSPHIGHO2_02_FULL_47_29]OGL75818.1 MAG: hypothetical protein A3E96_02705 [Candidatus Uhrbacteria bacterium RIFCSPHIGHO2_12_FULL_46_13]OGL83095.1 MAG: hypothetical protein A2936_05270 [Candidatus Uhrbacteria bacterium RIFCSPLOWO2_01_FULL_47_25]OGL84184.1 MAG: hypothetical protein A3I37_03380 [Candidatus Uhrbact